MQINCPCCGNACEIESEPIVGQHLVCPFCSGRFSYADDGKQNEDRHRGDVLEEYLHKKIVIRCPECGTEYEIDNDAIGSKCQCGICNRDFIARDDSSVEIGEAQERDGIAGTGEIDVEDEDDSSEQSGKDLPTKERCAFFTQTFMLVEKAKNRIFALWKICVGCVSVILTKERMNAVCLKAKEISSGTKNQIVRLWKSGMKGKALLCALAALLVWLGFFLMCGGGPKAGDVKTIKLPGGATVEKSKNDDQTADNAEAKAKFDLGLCCYEGGELIPQDKKAAADLFREAATLGHVKAQLYLGVCYYNGEGVQQDKTVAAKWFRNAAEQGDAEAQFRLAYCCADNDDKSEMVKWIRKSAEQGYAEAQCTLSHLYANGVGLARDKVEAVKWIRKAAAQNHRLALCNLANCHVAGDGVSQDIGEAVRLYRKSAELGLPEAQFQLGVSYANGLGVAQDWREAARWYRKSAEQGHAKAQLALGLCYQTGLGVDRDAYEASRWISEAKKDAQLRRELQDALKLLRR